MIDRGLRRGFDPAVEREALGAAESVRVGQEPRRDLRTLTTFTIDPVSALDFDDAISAEAIGDGRTRVWVHIADVAAHVPEGLAGRPRGAQAGHERVCARGRRAYAPACPLERRLLAAPRRRAPGRHGRAGAARRERHADGLLPLAHPLGRVSRLRPGRPHLRRAGAGRRTVARAAESCPRGRRVAAESARARRRARHSNPRSPSSPSTSRATSATSAAVCRPSPIA